MVPQERGAPRRTLHAKKPVSAQDVSFVVTGEDHNAISYPIHTPLARLERLRHSTTRSSPIRQTRRNHATEEAPVVRQAFAHQIGPYEQLSNRVRQSRLIRDTQHNSVYDAATTEPSGRMHTMFITTDLSDTEQAEIPVTNRADNFVNAAEPLLRHCPDAQNRCAAIPGNLKVVQPTLRTPHGDSSRQ